MDAEHAEEGLSGHETCLRRVDVMGDRGHPCTATSSLERSQGLAIVDVGYLRESGSSEKLKKWVASGGWVHV
jgi:hypothetical protein